MDDLKKISEIIGDLCRLVAESVNGVPERSFNDDPKFFLNSFFLKRYYYNLIAVSELIKRYEKDPFFHFPICLILRTNMQDFLIQCKFIALMRDDPNNFSEIKKLLGDHFETLSKDKVTFLEKEPSLKEIFPEFIDENGDLMKTGISAFKIYKDIKEDEDFSNDSKAFEIYSLFSKIEHLGILTFSIQDEENNDKILNAIIEAIKFVRIGIQNSLINLNFELDFRIVDEYFIELLRQKYEGK